MAALGQLRAIRAYLSIEATKPITFHTGKLVKTLLYALLEDLTRLHGLKGIISPIHISPLFTPGRREWELGDVVTPRYARVDNEEKLIPVTIDGEYIVHIGGLAGIVEKAAKTLEELHTPLQVKIKEAIIRYRLEKLTDITPLLQDKNIDRDKVLLYIKAPSKLFNIYTKSKLPKFNISAVEVLMAPFMLYTGQPTLSYAILTQAAMLLGTLVETYYSLTTVKPLLIPFNNRKTPTIIGKITYIIDTNLPTKIEAIENILKTAEIAGIGQSRQNGFGTVTWK